MPLLKELVGTLEFRQDYTSTFATLTSKLRDLHIDVEQESPLTGNITARCLSVVTNMLVWRCWSDRLILEVRSVGDNRTEVHLYAVPNLLRIRLRKGERPVDLGTVLSALRAAA